MYAGGCECGRIRYRISGEILEMSHCHCSQCRRMHGAAFGTYAGVGNWDFSWLRGAESVKRYASSRGVVRTFCPECGSNLQALFDEDPDIIYLTMGTLDGDPPHPEPFHIFVGSKAPWYSITDGLAQYDEWREGP